MSVAVRTRRCACECEGMKYLGNEQWRPEGRHCCLGLKAGTRLVGHQDGVDDVDDTVRLVYVGCRDVGRATLFVGDLDLAHVEREGKRPTLNGLCGVGTAALLNHLDEFFRGDFAGDDVVGEDLHKCVVVLGLEEVIDGAGGELGEGVIGGGEDGERAGAFEGVDQARSLDGGNEGLVDGRGHRVLDDILRRVHGGSANHRIFHLSIGCERGDSKRGACHEGNQRLLHCVFPFEDVAWSRWNEPVCVSPFHEAAHPIYEGAVQVDWFCADGDS